MKYLIYLLLICMMQQAAASEKISRTIAFVNDFPITEYDFQQRTLIMQSGSGNAPDDKLVLNTLIDEMVITDYAMKNDISIHKLQIEEAIKNIANNNNFKIEQLKKMLSKSGVDYEQFYQQINKQLLWDEIFRNEFTKMKESNVSVQKFYSNLPSTEKRIEELTKSASQVLTSYKINANSEFKVAEMFIIPSSERKLYEIIEFAKEGISFSKIKEKFPEEILLNDDNGEIGWLKADEMSQEYLEAVSNASIRGIAPPLTADNKILLLKVLDVKNTPIESKKVNADYLKLSYLQKSENEFLNNQYELFKNYLINKLRKNTFIKICDTGGSIH